jgi:hypothetical protein
MNEISNDVIRHCQALANLTRHYNDEIISFTIWRGQIDILLFVLPSDELLAKCKNITEEVEKDANNILTVRHTAEYSPSIELHWFEHKPLGEMGEKI